MVFIVLPELWKILRASYIRVWIVFSFVVSIIMINGSLLNNLRYPLKLVSGSKQKKKKGFPLA
jgi:hypothetical protein